MNIPPVNYLAILVAAIVIFLLGGLWYSPVLFAKKWIALQGRTEEQMRAQAASSNMPLMYDELRHRSLFRKAAAALAHRLDL